MSKFRHVGGIAVVRKLEIALLGVALAVVAACSAAGEASLQGFFTRLTLTLTVGDSVTEVYAQPGETADLSAVTAGEGLRVAYWLDSDGGAADLSQPVEADAEYTAVLAPELNGQLEPWLELDEHGLAHPGEHVTGEEIAAAVDSMFGGAVRTDVIARLDTVSEVELALVLDGLFPPEALSGLTENDPLSRIEAAGIIYPLYMDTLYGDAWGYDAVYAVIAPDLDPLSDGAGAMTACLDASGAVYYGEGLVNLDGYLYRVDASGLFCMDEEVDGLYYGADGRCTSGNEELDAYVAETLAPICAEYETREGMLRAAYLYVRDNFTYLRRNYYAVGDDGWQIDEALTMFSTGRGNCYCYAAAFWSLARGLGYDATAVAGTVGWERSPHGWVIMYDGDGTRIVYDVELEMAYHYNRGRYDVDLYAMEPEDTTSWNYIYGEQFR